MHNQDLDWLAAQQPGRLKTDPGARERALLALIRHTRSGPGGRGPSLGGVLRTRMFGFAAAIGVAAGAAAIVAGLVLSSGGRDGVAASPGELSHGAQAPQAAVHRHGSASSPLVRLADFVSNSDAPSGNATLVARTTTTGGNRVTVYDLYADDGEYFFSPTQSGLGGQVNANHNLAGGLFAREVAAAKLAATGDVRVAAQDMADAADPSHVISPSPAPASRTAIAKKLAALSQKWKGPGPYEPGSQYDNWAWENSQDALIAGSGQPQVRAGVLQILATLPGVTVTHATSGGQPTLVLTAGAAELGSGYTEQLTINADTGTPIQFVGGASAGGAGTVVDYEVSRVTFARLPAGTGSGE